MPNENDQTLSDYKVLSPLKHNKKRYQPGQTVEMPEELAEGLIATSVIEPLSGSPLEQTSKPSLTSTKGSEQAGQDPAELLNINTSTAEAIATGINGIGLKTAEQVVKLRESLPEKKFTSFDELKPISRVDWDAVFPLITLG